jgi:hypothetical protein
VEVVVFGGVGVSALVVVGVVPGVWVVVGVVFGIVDVPFVSVWAAVVVPVRV